MPDIEQLCLSGLAPSPDPTLSTDTANNIFQQCISLKVIVLKEVIIRNNCQAHAISQLVSIANGRNLRHLEIDTDFEDTHTASIFGRSFTLNGLTNFLVHGGLGDGQLNEFACLRALRLRKVVLNAVESQRMFRPAIENNVLHTIDIVFRKPTLTETIGAASCHRIQEYSWLRGATSIRRIGLFDFHFTQFPRNDYEFPLPSFLSSLPNLEVLEIESQHYDDADLCRVIVDIIKAAHSKTHLKTIYQKTISGVSLDNLRNVAGNYGIDLVWRPQPLEWPVNLEK
jgi:F-box/TPR repeat protein Pof3